MPGERIEEREKAWLVREGQKTDEALGFIIENFHAIVRRLRHHDQRRERDQILQRDRLRAWFGIVTTSAPITGVGPFGNILREAFIQPGGNPPE